MANQFEQFDQDADAQPKVNPFAQFDDDPPASRWSNVPEAFRDRLRRGELGTEENNPVEKWLIGDKHPNTLLGQALLEPANFATGLIEGLARGTQNPMKAFQGDLMKIDPETGMPGEDSVERAMETMQWGLRTTQFKRFKNGKTETIGTLPADQDFSHANPVVEKNLRDGWQDDGIHPSEALHDAGNDAFVRQELETAPHHEPDRSGIPYPTNSPVAEGTPRSVLAKTGEPHIDNLFDDPVLRKNVDNPVIDDTHEIPNSWGGSVPFDKPVVYRDKDFPKQMTVDGVTFDTAEPAAVHENVEQAVMEQLMAGGFDRATALKVAFWEFGEKVEDAWYAAHGMDPERVEAALKPYVDAIAARPIERLRPAYDEVVKGQGGISSIYISDLIAKSGLPKEQVHDIIRDAARAGKVSINRSATAEGSLTPEQAAGTLRVPGDETPYHTVRFRQDAQQSVPPDLFRGTYPDGDPAKAAPGPIEKPTAAEVKRAKEILAAESQPAAAGADVTRPENMPSLAEQPPPRPGLLAGEIKEMGQQLIDVGRDLQMLTTPMAAGTNPARAIAKDFANRLRRNRWEWQRADTDLATNFTREQRKRMWDALDEESVAEQLGESREHQGLVTLEPAERAAIEHPMADSQETWLHALDVGMVSTEGLPSYAPRMVLGIAAATEHLAPQSLNELGRNVFTRTSQMLHRKHMMAEETETAAKELVRKRMEAAGKSPDEIEAALEDVKIARDIRSLPLATARLKDAIAGRTLINQIEAYGKSTGAPTVSFGDRPAKSWFTIDHPAFKRWEPDLETNPVTGQRVARTDDAGNVIFKQTPIYIHPDFEGPLRAVLNEPSGAAYGALMALKGKTMGLIMNSPLIHNAVEWGRAFPGMPGKMMTFRVYRDGAAAMRDLPTMQEAIDHGLVPIGKRFFNQDINAIMEEPDLAPGRSLTAKMVGAVPGLFDAGAEVATRAAIDKMGDFWHNKLLWDQVAKLQAGLYTNFRDAAMSQGIDRSTAAYMAAHWANRYAGALPQEAMSNGARKIANLLMFSRSFTLGNVGAMKDMLTGLPKDVLAQIERDVGTVSPEAVGFAKNMAKRKAVAIVAMDIGLLYVANSVVQSAINMIRGDHTLGKEYQGYADRAAEELSNTTEHPLSILFPMGAGAFVGSRVAGLPGAAAGAAVGAGLHALSALSSTNENEPGRENRIRVGYGSDGTAIYARSPFGKIGEEFTGYFTGPLDMIRKKLSTLARPGLQILANDAGYGRKVYDPNPDTTYKQLQVAIAIAEHLAGSQLPEGQINALSDLVKGEGDAKVNALQAFGPIAGITFSKGAPGGPAVGEYYNARSRSEFEINAALPDIRRQILRGDMEGARQRMNELHIDLRRQQAYIRTTLDPATRVNPRVMRQMTPEQRDRILNAPRAP